MSETYELAGKTGTMKPPGVGVRFLLTEEPAAITLKAASALAACWEAGKWPGGEGKRPGLRAMGRDVEAHGEAVVAHLIGEGVASGHIVRLGLEALKLCQEGIVRPQEVAAQEDFTETPSPAAGSSKE